MRKITLEVVRADQLKSCFAGRNCLEADKDGLVVAWVLPGRVGYVDLVEKLRREYSSEFVVDLIRFKPV